MLNVIKCGYNVHHNIKVMWCILYVLCIRGIYLKFEYHRKFAMEVMVETKQRQKHKNFI